MLSRDGIFRFYIYLLALNELYDAFGVMNILMLLNTLDSCFRLDNFFFAGLSEEIHSKWLNYLHRPNQIKFSNDTSMCFKVSFKSFFSSH